MKRGRDRHTKASGSGWSDSRSRIDEASLDRGRGIEVAFDRRVRAGNRESCSGTTSATIAVKFGRPPHRLYLATIAPSGTSLWKSSKN